MIRLVWIPAPSAWDPFCLPMGHEEIVTALLLGDSEPWKVLALEAVAGAGWPYSFSLAHTHPHIASRQRSPAQEGRGGG